MDANLQKGKNLSLGAIRWFVAASKGIRLESEWCESGSALHDILLVEYSKFTCCDPKQLACALR
jgi:hypothetical protein